jgi:hypothetical protein
MAQTDKPYSLDGSLNPDKVYQLDQMLEDLYRRLARAEKTVQTAFPEGESVDVTRWKTGPWTFDSIVPTVNVARLSHNLAAATEYADYAPEGIDTAVELHVIPQGAGASISGIRHFGRVSRKLCIANGSSTNSVTIPHEEATSTGRFRFNLPNSEDIVLGPYQVLWASYNPELQRWQCMVTPHNAGGLGAGSLQGTSEVFLLEADVSEAELETAGNPKKVLIAAPGAGIVIVPLQLQVYFSLTVNYTNSPTMHLEYDGGTVDITGSITSGASSGAPKTVIGGTGSASFEVASSVNDIQNKSVGFCTNTNFTGAGTATAKVRVWYTLANFN